MSPGRPLRRGTRVLGGIFLVLLVIVWIAAMYEIISTRIVRV